MNLYVKLALSVTGIFLGGLTQYYQVHYAVHPGMPVSWLPLVMAGLTPVAGYLIGLFQTAPGETK